MTPEATYTGTPDSKFMLAMLFGTAAKCTDDLSSAVNPFYAGRIVRDGQSYPGEHAAMVTGEEFDRAQDLLGRDEEQLIAATRPHSRSFMYEGLLHCGHCTRVLCGELHTNRQGHEYVYYRCSRRRQGYPECYAPAPREGQVTEDILAALRRVTIDAHFLEWAKEARDWWAMREPRTPVGAVHLAEQVTSQRTRAAAVGSGSPGTSDADSTSWSGTAKLEAARSTGARSAAGPLLSRQTKRLIAFGQSAVFSSTRSSPGEDDVLPKPIPSET